MSKKNMSKITMLPWSFLLIIYLMITYFKKIPIEGLVGYMFIGLGVIVLIIEFYKSGDVNSVAFFIDQIFALLGIIISTALLTYLYFFTGKSPNFFYWFGYVIILGDAVFSPFNAFRMALRNFGV